MAVIARIYKKDAGRHWMARYVTDPSGTAVAWNTSRSVTLPRSREDMRLFNGCEVLVEAAHPLGHIDVADEWRLAPNGHPGVREGPMTREKIAEALTGKDLRGATAVVFFDSFHAEEKGRFNLVVAARTETLLRAACSSLDQLCNYDLYRLSPRPGGSINAVSSYAPEKYLNVFTVASHPSFRECNMVFVHLDKLAPPNGSEVVPDLAKMYLEVALIHMPEVVEDPTPVVRAHPYALGCLLEKRIERAIANADLHGVSTCVLYDPSAGGPRATEYQPKPDPLWRVIVITKPQDSRAASVLKLNVGGTGGISLIPDEDCVTVGNGTNVLTGRPYYTSQDFRAYVREHQKSEDGTIIFIPVPGLVYKQQWGPASSHIEPEVVVKCVGCLVECLCALTE